MALKVKWSAEARTTYQRVLDYLTENWTQREVQNFADRTASLLDLISRQPHLFRPSAHESIRKAVIGKQNSLFYQIKGTEIRLLSFWDNRQDPKKNKFE